MIACSDFDWTGSGSIAVAEQLAIAIYPNPKGVVVVRQERAWDEDSDTVIFVNPDHARAVAAAILEAAGLEPDVVIAGLLAPPATPPVADPTAAERQRRHRQRLKQGGG